VQTIEYQPDFIPNHHQLVEPYFVVGGDATAPSTDRFTQGSSQGTTRLRVNNQAEYQQLEYPQQVPSHSNIPNAAVNELDMSEIAECERCARMYIEKDDFEIEIANVA
jgi:hypothetical protein